MRWLGGTAAPSPIADDGTICAAAAAAAPAAVPFRKPRLVIVFAEPPPSCPALNRFMTTSPFYSVFRVRRPGEGRTAQRTVN